METTLFMRTVKYTVLLTAICCMLVVLGVGYLILTSRSYPRITPKPADYKNTVYIVSGQRIELKDGVAETAARDSASTIVTRYFGNELKTDLNDDGREDVVFLLTQNTGGSGKFYYAVATLNTTDGYVGSDGYFLGDRIAPQTTELSHNPRHKNVIVVNYADRAPGEPMTTRPSLGKSVYLKLNPATMQWGVVEPDFEGESARGNAATAPTSRM